MKYYTSYFINKKAILNNLENIKNTIKPSMVCAMVKANAYGHDIKTVCEILKGKVEFFGVANIQEAKKIRTFDKETKILIVGKTPNKYYNWCAKNNVSVTISDNADIPKNNILNILNIHIKIDTGLSRFGIKTKTELCTLLNILSKIKNTKIEGCFTHFATKSEDINFIKKQYEVFIKFKKHFPKKTIFHCCNSFASLHLPQFKLDMVRVGFALYDSVCVACKIETKIINIKTLTPGESVGYDRTFTATKPTKVAVIPVGYADGLDRHLSNNFCLFVNNKPAKIIGNICMDVCMLDITDINCHIFDTVEILGNNLSLKNYAKKLNTSPYEIMLKFNHARMNIVKTK